MIANWSEWATSEAWRTTDVKALPPPPRALEEVFWLAVDQEVDVRRLIDLVAKDPVITIRVLRLANVAAAAPMRDVTSIQQAVVRLGTHAVRNAVLATCFASWAQGTQVYGSRGAIEVEHAIGTACLARHVARCAGANPEESFVHGLLHDVGKLFLLQLRNEFVKRGGPRPSSAEVEAVLASHHASAGGSALQLWGLPPAVREPVRWHHDPLSDPSFPQASAIVYTANRLSHRYGFGCQPGDESSIVEDPACAALGLTPKWLDDMDLTAMTIFDAARQLVV